MTPDPFSLLIQQIGYYFAFTQSYFSFLLFPAVFGFSCWVLLGHYSLIYAVVNCLWCVTGVSAIETKRKDFKHEKEIMDPVTGETVQIFPSTKRLSRQALQIPFAFLACLALG